MPNTATIAIFANLSNADKIVIVFREAAKQLPKAVGDALLALVSPANLALTVVLFLAFAAGQALGYGLIIDVIAIAGGILLAGAAAIDGVALLIEAVTKTASANKQSDLEAAGKIYAELRRFIATSDLRGRFEAHHLWEKQFARLIGIVEDDIIAAPVLPRYHRAVNGIV